MVWWLALPPRGWWVLFPVGVTMFMLALAGQPLRNRLWLGGLGGVAHYALALPGSPTSTLPGMLLLPFRRYC